MNTEWMRGCATALVTPFGSDGSVDIERMRALVGRQIEGGVRLLVPCGTTGESVTMSEEENREVIRATVGVARERGGGVAPGGDRNSTAPPIETPRAAREKARAPVLSFAPYYKKPTKAGLYAHFRAVA